MNNRSHAKATRGSRIRTVIVQISRKLRATYRVRIGGRLFSRLLAALLGVYAAQVFALPQGGVVQSGAVTINTPNANSMVLNQGTSKAVIDWQSFSIGSGQSVQFLQPGASSVALNRVVGGDVSSIFGSLSANGQVFLVNPNGVLFAPGAQVNVGGLVASTLNLSNADFLAGKYTFSGNSGASVVNNGMIRAGYVALAGAKVANAGTIEAAQGGSIGLLAGSRVTVDPAGAGLVKFSVDGAAVDAAASNSGTLVAEGGQVAMLASAVSDTLPTVINQSGVIRANSVAENNGVVTLSGGATGIVKVSGTIEARGDNAGETGGTVKVLGDRVGLMAGAKVDASGDAGGGTVLVGGNYQGNGPEQNALVTLVDRSATVNADATGQGDGGRVIVWADDTTRFAGQISARGGAAGGDGGFSEVSGKNHLAFQGGADLRAPQGQTGTLLLDPTDLRVVHDATGVADSFIDFDASNPAEFQVISSDPGPSVISDATINAQLAASNVVVQTSPIGAGSGDITFDGAGGAIVFDAGGTGSILTFSAHRNITVNTTTSFTNGTGALNLFANGWTGTVTVNNAVSSTGNVNIGGKDVAINATVMASEAGKNVNISVGDFAAGTFTSKAVMMAGAGGKVSVTGGTSGNIFDFSADPGNTVTIVGGSGVDELKAPAGATYVLTGTDKEVGVGSLFSATGIEKVTGTGTSNVLQGTSSDTTYTTSGDNSVSAGGISFSGIGTINAGTGSDTVSGATTYTLTGNANEVLANGIKARNIEKVTGTDTLVGSATDTTYVTGANNAVTVASITFEGVNTLDAKGGVDTLKGATTYTLTGIANEVQANSITAKGVDVVTGTGTITGSATGTSYVLGAADGDVTAAGIAFSGVTNLNAGAGSDTLSGATTYELTGTDKEVTAKTVAATGIENVANAGTVVGSAADTTYTITGDSAVTANNIAFGGVTNLDAKGAIDQLTGATTSYVIAGDTAVGANKIAFTGIDSVTAAGTVEGSAADTTYTITGDNALTANNIKFGGVTNLDAKAATDELTGATTDYVLTGDNAVKANNIDFTGIDSVAAAGTVVGSATATVYDTTAGANKLSANKIAFTGVTKLDATAAAGDTFTGAASYQIDGANAVTANGIAATGIENVTNAGTVVGSATGTTYTINGDNALTANSIAFTGVNKLDATAAVGDTLTGATSSYVIDGANAVTANKIAASGIESVTAAGTVVGSDADTKFSIVGVGAVDVANINFTGVANLTGGAGKDTFVFADAGSLTGTVDGGDPTTAPGDTIDLTAKTGPLAINTAAGTATGMGSFTNIELISANDHAATTLTGSDINITGVNSGSADGVGFQGVYNLQGTATSKITGLVGGIVAGTITDGGAATTLSGVINSTGNQTYTGAVTLAAATTTAGANVSFGNTVGGAQALTINSAGTTTLNGNVDVASLTTDAAGSTSIGAASIKTSGAQTYDDAVTQTAAATTLESGSNVILAAGLGGNKDLTVKTNGNLSLGAATTVASLTTQGSTTLTGAGALTTPVVNAQGNLKLGNANQIADGATVNVTGTLDTGANAETVGKLNVNGGTVNGTGVLTSTGGYNLTSATVNGALGAGTLTQVGGASSLAGTSAASTVNIEGGTLTLGNTANRLTAANSVGIAAGATLDTGAAAQALAGGAVTNSGTLTATGDISAGSITSSGTASYGGNVTTTGAQSYTGALSTAANSTLEAAGSLTSTNADATTIGDGTTFRMTDTGTVDVSGNYQGSVKVDGSASSVTLTDFSAETPFVVNQMMVDSGANVTLNSAGALTVDAANLSQLAKLTVRVAEGGVRFLNSSTERNGQKGILATGGITMQVDEGDVNTETDPMWINAGTPNLSVTINGAFKAWLAGNVSSDAVTRKFLNDAADGVGASRAEMVRDFLHELKRNVGIGAVEDLVLFGGIDMEGIIAPLSFSNLAVKLPKCAGEQANSQQCN
ncbi:filamentous hemagglutinin N-terminal domain-containing protein [Ramlibacter sp.]|uniref:beta strand repeat-containing protein n=1 Tax=Ramlibacter sp. TaxID=1917967 RepID=UPI002D6DB9D0|nr:filamentous hemagglutinin N-terminal domain-containing protein [Ramlibacter sp.]HYD75489.1 filamentous hemagglutinin N-terminal domain-containing protein [Ramlibacter sp.]